MRFSSAIARKYGRPLPIAAKMTDVPCHSWVWPTLLAHAGVKFLQIGSNGASGHLCLPHLFGGKARMAPASSVITRRTMVPACGAKRLA